MRWPQPRPPMQGWSIPIRIKVGTAGVGERESGVWREESGAPKLRPKAPATTRAGTGQNRSQCWMELSLQPHKTQSRLAQA